VRNGQVAHICTIAPFPRRGNVHQWQMFIMIWYEGEIYSYEWLPECKVFCFFFVSTEKQYFRTPKTAGRIGHNRSRCSNSLQARRFGVRNPAGMRFLPRPSRPVLGPIQPLYSGHCVSFPGVRRPGRAVHHSSSSSTEVKERVELYLYSPFLPSWHVTGWTYLLLYSLLVNR